jgi:hypothetical protein
MRKALVFSLALHVGLAAAFIVGIPDFGEELAVREPVPVQVVSEDQLAQAAPEVTREQPTDQPERPEAQPEPAEQEAPPPAPAPPEPENAQPAEPEPAPEPPAPEPEPQQQAEPNPEPAPEPEPEPAPEPDPEPEAAPQPPEKPQPEPDPEPEPEPEPAEARQQAERTAPAPARKPELQTAKREPEREAEPEPEETEQQEPHSEEPKRQKRDLTSILKDVEKDFAGSNQEQDNPNPDAQNETSREGEDAQETQQAVQSPEADRVAPQLTASQIDAIRQQLANCWSPPVGARDAQDLRIEIRVQLERDGSVRSAELISRERMGESFYRAAAESAMRAVRICSPLEGLPPEKYEQWQTLLLNFDPQEMLGG